MSRELVQRRGLLRRTYRLDPDGIRVTTQRLGSGNTFCFPYELMYGERIEVWTSSRIAFWATVVVAAFAVIAAITPDAEPYAWLFWSVIAVATGAYYASTRCRQVGFADRAGTLFFFSDSRVDELAAFLDEARRRARERARAVAIPMRPTGDALHDLQRAIWLHDKGIVTDDELAEFKRVLDGRGAPIRPDERLPN